MRVPIGIACTMIVLSCGNEDQDNASNRPMVADEESSLDALVSTQAPPMHDHDDQGQVLSTTVPPTSAGKSDPETLPASPVTDQGNQLPPATPIPSPLPSPKSGNAQIVEFHIAMGTGTASFNGESDLLSLKVGQTLRLINDDTVTHRLHTNGAPCPHGVAFAPGKSFDCQLTKPFNPKAAAGPLYDHIAGKKAQFWLEVVK